MAQPHRFFRWVWAPFLPVFLLLTWGIFSVSGSIALRIIVVVQFALAMVLGVQRTRLGVVVDDGAFRVLSGFHVVTIPMERMRGVCAEGGTVSVVAIDGRSYDTYLKVEGMGLRGAGGRGERIALAKLSALVDYDLVPLKEVQALRSKFWRDSDAPQYFRFDAKVKHWQWCVYGASAAFVVWAWVAA